MTSVETDIPFLDDVEQRRFSAEPPDEFLTFEELFNMTRVDQLRTPTLALLKARFPQQGVEEAMIGFDLMADLHFGRKRRSGAEEATHPALVGLMDLLANPDLTVDELNTDYLHDTLEDCDDLGLTSKHISNLLTLHDYPKSRADAIALGVEGLTREHSDDQNTYLRKIIIYDKLVPHLHLRDRKLVDTTHTVLSYSREIQDAKSSTQAKRYLDRKALPTLNLGEATDPHTSNTKKLRQAIIGCNEAIALQNQGDHQATRPAFSHSLFTARVRV